MYGQRSTPLFALTITMVLVFFSPLSHSGLLSFDELDTSEGTISQQSYAGFQWDPKWAIGSVTTAGYKNAASSGRQFLYNGNSQSNLGIRRADPFDFLGASFATTASHTKRTFAVRVRALDENSVELGTTGYQAVSSVPTWFNVTFENVFRLEIDSYGGVFTMDDFSYRDTLSKLSEAGSLVLLGVGVLGLWGARRRIRQPV